MPLTASAVRCRRGYAIVLSSGDAGERSQRCPGRRDRATGSLDGIALSDLEPGLLVISPRRAHQRLKKENSAGLQLGDEAVRELKKGDHYLLVTLRMKKPEGAFSFSSFR
jgi:hypothetical protein